MTIRLCRVCRGWHDPHEWPAECIQAQESKAAAFPTPMVSGDTLSKPLQSMATGKWHTSKSAMRREYKAHGFVELGTERVRPKAPGPVDYRPTIARALQRHGII